MGSAAGGLGAGWINALIGLADERGVSSALISLVIPTLNEAENLPSLVQRIAGALRGWRYEIIVVDDGSTDGTADVCARLALAHPLRVIGRSDARDGLAGAVLAGMSLAGGEVFVVMDADLQHPPEALPELLRPIEEGEADFVIGSRYVAGSRIEGRWGFLRRLNSRAATALARPLSRGARDPMSGFFALQRQVYERTEGAAPVGYKVGLELLCRSGAGRVVEVPIRFGPRAGGKSKLSLREQLRYVDHVSRLYDFAFPRLAPAVKFALAGAIGVWVALGVMLSASAAGVGLPGSAILGYLGLIAVSWVFHVRHVGRDREMLRRGRPWREFVLRSLAEWGGCAAAAMWAAARLHAPSATAMLLIACGCGLVVRCIIRRELRNDLRGLRRGQVKVRREQGSGDSQPLRRAA